MKITNTRIRQIIKEEITSILGSGLNESTLEKELSASQQNSERTSQGTKYPIIRVSGNQFIQLNQDIRFNKNDEVIVVGYTVDFATRANRSGLSGSGQLSHAEGASGASKAIDAALESIKADAAEGKGPFGTDPIDINAKVTILK
jgi:hypothetical protein